MPVGAAQVSSIKKRTVWLVSSPVWKRNIAKRCQCNVLSAAERAEGIWWWQGPHLEAGVLEAGRREVGASQVLRGARCHQSRHESPGIAWAQFYRFICQNLLPRSDSDARSNLLVLLLLEVALSVHHAGPHDMLASCLSKLPAPLEGPALMQWGLPQVWQSRTVQAASER